MVRGRWIVAVAVLPWAVALGACGKPGASSGRVAAPDTAKWNALYVSDTLPSASGRGRVAKLAIGPDTLGVMSLEFVGLGVTFHAGRWSSAGDLLTLQPTRGDGTPSENPLTWRLEGRRLVPVEWDKHVYGAQGLPLIRQETPAAVRPDSNAGAAR